MNLKTKILVSCVVAFFAGCATNGDVVVVPKGTCSVDNTAKCEANGVSVVGVYKAMLPCADCEGIDTTLNLKADNTFTYDMVYKTPNSDKDSQSGTYSIKGDVITTTNLYKEQTKFKFDKGALRLLDMDGKVVTGPLEAFYIFKKSN